MSMQRLRRNDVSKEVILNVLKYFDKELPQYNVGLVLRASEYPDDSYLYHVLAHKKDKSDWACWTCWNETTQCLNYGHYNLVSEEAAMEILNEYYFRIKEE